MKRNKKGFTLVELVIVIAVIAILAAVLIPTFSNVIENSKESSRYQQAVNAEKELFGDGYLPEDTVGFVIGVNYNGNHYYQIQRGQSLQKMESVDETYLHEINGIEMSNNKVHVYTYNVEANIATLKINGAVINVTNSSFSNYFTYSGSNVSINSSYVSQVEEIVFPESFNYNNSTVTNYSLSLSSDLTNLVKITVPENVEMYWGMFSSIPNDFDITFTGNRTSITNGALANSKVISVSFPEHLTTIDLMAFNGCTSLTSIVIPSSVNYIGPGCFANNNNLQTVTFEDPNGWITSGGWPPPPSNFNDPFTNAQYFGAGWSSEVTR